MNHSSDRAMVDRARDVDDRIKAGSDRFLRRLKDLREYGVSDAKQIEAEFLKSFQDGNRDRAPLIVRSSIVVEEQVRAFDRQSAQMVEHLARVLFGKDRIATLARLVVAAEGQRIGTLALEELPNLFSWLDTLRNGRDPGPLPKFDTPDQIDEAQRRLSAISDGMFLVGDEVAACAEMLADTIELRIEYLHEFKLNHLKLNPTETLERIMKRFERQPASVARRLALELLKGTIASVAGSIAEKVLPWSTIVDMFERLQIGLVGQRVSTKVSGADALLNLETELSNQGKALEGTFSECSRLIAALELPLPEKGGEAPA